MAVATLDTETQSTSAWRSALGDLAKAESAYRQYDAEVFSPAYHREAAFLREHGVENLCPAHGKVRALHIADGCLHKMPDEVSDRIEDLSTELCRAQSALMDTPSPDLTALRWKLDHILELEHQDDDGGSLAAWSGGYVRQMLSDIDRLLPKS